MIQITLDGKKLFALLLVGMALLLTLAVSAFQAFVAPSAFGHTTDEIQFNVSYISPSTLCGMSSYETIPNATGNAYCALTAWDDDSSVPLASATECHVRGSTDGRWEYRFAHTCGDSVCKLTCIKFN